MADSKITALTSIGASTDPANDPLVLVDVSDTSMAATGTTKKVTLNQLLGAGGTATLASATITGDLTVDTSTLKVDSANNRVGIGTASPTDTLDVNGRVTAARFLSSSSSASLPALAVSAGNGVYNSGTNEVGFSVNSTLAMTLNSTGLGIGASPVGRLNIANTGADVVTSMTAVGVQRWQFIVSNSTAAFSIYDQTNSGTRLLIDTSGNVGVGVTPSAWSGITPIQISRGSFAADTGSYILSQNVYNNGSNRYIATAAAMQFQAIPGTGFLWNIAPSGTAGTAITFTQAMTLDASGNLLVGTTSASGTRTYFKGSSTSTDYVTTLVNSSSKVAFGVRNDGLIITGSPTDVATLPNAPYNLTTGSAANLFIDSIGVLYRSTSSMKYKSDIADSTRGLADVLKLRPVTYKAKNSGDTVFGGLIAEEVAAAGLTEFVQYAPDNTPDAIHYGNMVSLLIAAIKELSAEVNALKNA
jgi:hypothetical protein